MRARAMKATVRPLDDDPDLEDGVAAVRIAAYPDFPEVSEKGFYTTVYRWLRSHPLGDEMRRWVAVTEEGQVVGHLSALPQYYRVNGRRVVAHTPGDYMALPEHGFQAIMLMRTFFRATENLVACDMAPAVVGVETRLGAEVAGDLSYAAKLLNVSRLPAPPVPAALRKLLGLSGGLAPAGGGHTGQPAAETPDAETPDAGMPGAREHVGAAPQRPRAPIPGPLKYLLNRGIERVDEALISLSGGNRLPVEEIGDFDESFDDLFERVAAVMPCTPEKDAAFLQWRYRGPSPQAPVTVLGVRRGGRLLGYAVLKVASHGQDGYIMDLTALPGHPEVVRALLGASVRRLRKDGVQIIRYRFVESPASARAGDLGRMGFFYRKGRSNKLLVKFSEPALHEAARDLENWSYHVGDGEATFSLR